MGKRSAQGVSPEKGLEKNQSGGADCGRQAASGGNVGKVGQSVGRGGGSRWAAPGLSTGCPCLCPRTGEAAHRSRSDLHISTARGSNSAPSGGLFCPAGLTTSVPGLGLLPGNVMRGHPRTPVRASHTTQLALQPRNPRRQPVLSWRHRKNKVATPKGQNARKAAPALAGTL